MVTLRNLFEATNVCLNESPTSDQYEHDVATSIDTFFKKSRLPYSATRPTASTTYPDVKIMDKTKKNTITWTEVKMNHGDRLYNGRFQFKDGVWASAKSTASGPNPIAELIASALNSDDMAKRWLIRLAKFLGKDVNELYLPSAVISPSTIARWPGENIMKVKDFLENQPNPDSGTNRGNKLVTNTFGAKLNVAKMVVLHYTSGAETGGKSAQASYLQAGDDFYQFKKSLNPLKFRGVPAIDSMSNADINQYTPELRMSPRGSTPTSKQGYEFMLEIKFKQKNGLPNSPFSFMPGTNKPQPTIQK